MRQPLTVDDIKRVQEILDQTPLPDSQKPSANDLAEWFQYYFPHYTLTERGYPYPIVEFPRGRNPFGRFKPLPKVQTVKLGVYKRFKKAPPKAHLRKLNSKEIYRWNKLQPTEPKAKR